MRALAVVSLLVVAGCAAPQVAPNAPSQVFLCRYQLNPYYLPPSELRGGPSDRLFARVKEAQAAGVDLTLPRGPALQGFRARMTSGWVTLRPHVFSDHPFTLAITKPLEATPVLSFEPGALAEWIGSDDDGAMRVELKSPKNFRSASTLQRALRCEDTTIGRPRAKTEASATDAGELTQIVLPGGVEIPVSAAPDGPLEGTLNFREGALKVVVTADQLDAQGEWVKLRKRLGSAVVTGWVRKSDTRPLEPMVGGLIGNLAGGARRGDGVGKPDWGRCTTTAPLFVRLGREVMTIGEVHPQAAVVPGDVWEEFTTIELPELTWVQLVPSAQWMMKTAEISNCLK
jgi:hypothetical protein